LKPPRIYFIALRTPVKTTATIVKISTQIDHSLKKIIQPENHNYVDVVEKPKPQILSPQMYVDYAISLEPRAKPLF
jgi:hypothetical protein